MTASEIREVLDRAGVRPNRKLGQNFLIDANQAECIVAQLDPCAEDTVVEVGPGTGALSECLLGRVKRLVLIEFDERLAMWLRERFSGRDDVEVHHIDAVKFDARTLWKYRPVKFLGNLPYSAGGAILRNFLSGPHPFERAVVMLQREVIDRMAAVPKTKAYGVLSLRIQCEWEVERLKVIGPESFFPRPQIDSEVVRLMPAAARVFDRRRFDELIRRGFAQRRKQLGKQLPPDPPWAEVAGRLGLGVASRAEELSLDDWLAVTAAYDDHPLKDLPQSGEEVFDVVDEKDCVVGQAGRDEVHVRGLLHRAVHLFVVNGRGELLLQRRSMWKDVHPGTWDSSVAGHLDAGEDYVDAVKREMQEEMGIAEGEPEEIGKIEPCEETGWEHVKLYLLRWQGQPKFPCAEVDAVMWMAADEISAWIAARPQDFASGFLACWRLARGGE